MAGDVASSLTHYGRAGLHFTKADYPINADYTVTSSRLPVGHDIGLAALTHTSRDRNDGDLRPVRPIGGAIATALGNPGFDPPKRR